MNQFINDSVTILVNTGDRIVLLNSILFLTNGDVRKLRIVTCCSIIRSDIFIVFARNSLRTL